MALRIAHGHMAAFTTASVRRDGSQKRCVAARLIKKVIRTQHLNFVTAFLKSRVFAARA